MRTSYFQSVYDVVSLIPYGRVTTYGAIADFLGLGSARMVGWALNQLPNHEIHIPAHRVVNRNGFLSGQLHFGTQNSMAQRLQSEGIPVIDNQIQEFNKYFWKPEVD